MVAKDEVEAEQVEAKEVEAEEVEAEELKPLATRRKPSRKLLKKGELPWRTRSANNATYLQLLWKARPP